MWKKSIKKNKFNEPLGRWMNLRFRYFFNESLGLLQFSKTFLTILEDLYELHNFLTMFGEVSDFTKVFKQSSGKY